MGWAGAAEEVRRGVRVGRAVRVVIPRDGEEGTGRGPSRRLLDARIRTRPAERVAPVANRSGSAGVF